MVDKIYNVLFLCTGNSARSILAEALLNRDGEGRFRAYSAGSFPKGEVHPQALSLLAGLGMQGDSWQQKTPLHLYHITSALRRVGLEAEARMIAAEAVARSA